MLYGIYLLLRYRCLSCMDERDYYNTLCFFVDFYSRTFVYFLKKTILIFRKKFKFVSIVIKIPKYVINTLLLLFFCFSSIIKKSYMNFSCFKKLQNQFILFKLNVIYILWFKKPDWWEFHNSIINSKTFEYEVLPFKNIDKIIKKGFFWVILNNFFIFLLFKFFSKKKNYNKINCNYKITGLSNNTLFVNNKKNFALKNQLFLLGLNSFWKHLRFWLLPLSFSIIFLYYTFFLRSLPFMKVLFSYFLIINMFYLLVSGFVFFFKKYQYRLYTTAIQRFWRRSLIIFWLIEVSLFIVFIYLTLNASQEPIHVYDNIQIYKTHFYSWRYFLVKIIPASLLIIFTYILLIFNKWNTFSKINNIVFCITFLLFFIFWLEFYQFFYILTCYGITEWVYDISEHLWNLETDFKRTRIVNHYVTICLIAKFWHIVFAVFFWIFFVLRGLESSRYRYPLLVSNLQNFLIIYIMSWLYMYPWFKYIFRKIFDLPYYWFFINNRKLGFFIFFNDIKLFYWGFLELFYTLFESYSTFFKKNILFYWYESSQSYSFINNTQFRKHNIRDFFLRNF